MSDILTRSDPVPSQALSGAGVTIRLAPPLARYSLRARDAGVIEALTGVTAPAQVGRFVGDLACLGPDEWLWRSAEPRTFSAGEALASVVDVSERSVCLIVEGHDASRVLAAGCPLDLDRFAVGRVTRTLFETVEIVLYRTADHSWQVEVWRSFAPWLWTALSAAATH